MQKLRKKYSLKITKNLKSRFKVVDYIVLSPGISLKKSKYKNDLSKYEKNYYRYRFVIPQQL